MVPSNVKGVRLLEIKQQLGYSKNVRFKELLKICEEIFGKPRNSGTSHHVFKMPWPGDPRINLQPGDKDAKRYQVKQVVKAIEKLELLISEEQNNEK
jgi:hypothetical protein